MNRARWLVVTIEVIFFALATGCGSPAVPADLEPDTGPDGTVDVGVDIGATPAPVSFSNDLLPIFQNRCVSCHIAATHPVLTPSQAYAELTQQGRTLDCGPGYPLVTPGDPSSSGLAEVIKAQPICGVSMPRDQTPLCTAAPNECATIGRWITEGALNN